MASMQETNIRNILYEEIILPLQEEALIPTPFLDDIMPNWDDVESVGGKQYYSYITQEMTQGGGSGPRGAAKALPAHTNPVYTRMRIDMCRFYATGDVDGLLQAISDKNKVADSVTRLTQSVRNKIKHQLNAFFNGPGTTAIARIVSGQSSSATVTCDYDYLYPGTRRLIPGLVIDSYDATTGMGTAGQGIDSEAITSIDTQTTFTHSATADDASDYIMFEDGSGSNVDATPMGLAAIVDGPDDQSAYRILEDLQGGDASVYPQWRSYVSSNNGTARYLTDEMLEDVALEIELASNQKLDETYFLYSNQKVRLRFRKDESGNFEWVNKTSITPGVKAVPRVQIAETMVRWKTDKMCGGESLYLLDPRTLVYKSTKMKVMDPEGYDRVENYDTNRIQVRQYAQVGCTRRCTHAVIRDLNET